MQIRIEKKNDDKYILYLVSGDIRGIILSAEDIIKLKNNLNQMFEYEMTEIGDTF